MKYTKIIFFNILKVKKNNINSILLSNSPLIEDKKKKSDLLTRSLFLMGKLRTLFSF